MAIGPALEVAIGRVPTWHNPGGSALKHIDMGRLRGNLGHKLDSAGAGTHHSNALSTQVNVMTPMAGVKSLPGKGGYPGNIRQSRLVQRAGCQHHMAGIQSGLSGQLDLPAGLRWKPSHALHVASEPDQGAQLVLVGNPQNVGLNLGLLRVGPGPVRIGLERKRIQVRRHIACATGVDVIAPGTAHLLTALQYGYRMHATASQTNRRTKPAKAGTHNGYIQNKIRHIYCCSTGPDPSRSCVQRTKSNHIWRISASCGVRPALGSSIVTTGTRL